MAAVLSGFTIIWIVIAVGFLLARFRLVPADAQRVMGLLVYYVGLPSMLFVTVSAADLGDVLGVQFVIAALSAFATLAIFLIVARFLLRGRSAAELFVGGVSSSLVNSANLGFPIAAYVIGDLTFAAPVLMFQLLLYMPVQAFVLDQLGRQDAGPRGRSLLRGLRQSAVNPMILGSLAGLAFAWQGWSLPEPVQESLALMGGIAIPLALLAFGITLVSSSPLSRSGGRRRDVLLASVLKLGVHPALAYVLAAFGFGLDGVGLLAAVVMASLPAAQNALVLALRYDRGVVVARDTVLVSTLIGVPAMALVAVLLA